MLDIITTEPDATLPCQLTWVMMSSKANWEAIDKDWENVAASPSGTGLWKLEAFVLSGSILIQTVFNWPGLGFLLSSATCRCGRARSWCWRCSSWP